MAGEVFWEPISKPQYDVGRMRRLMPEGILANNWYSVRHVRSPEDNIACYAVEFLVEVIRVQPIDDMFDVQAYFLDYDGQKVSKGDNLLNRTGLLVESNDKRAEGYLLDASERLGLGPVGVEDKELIGVS